MQTPTRTVHCCDAIAWLEAQSVIEGASFVTSLPGKFECRADSCLKTARKQHHSSTSSNPLQPHQGGLTFAYSAADVSEMHETHGHVSKETLQLWKAWFVNAAQLVLTRCPDNGVAMFFQTDIKVEGTWVDKSYLVLKAAEATGHDLLWHKLVCRVSPGTATFGKPGYHHMLCFSKHVRAEAAKATPDILPAPGPTTWTRGMGTAACAAACKFILHNTSTRTVVDPFCGHGTVLAVANELGLNAIGVELSPKRARQAEKLTVTGLALDKGNSKRPEQQHAQCEQQNRSES